MLIKVTKRAEDIGQELSGITKSKMRQYFDDIKGLRRKIDSGLGSQQIKVQLRLILSRIAYDSGRAGKKDIDSYNQLKAFLADCINKIIGSKNIKEATDEFITFIETVYGYFYFYAK